MQRFLIYRGKVQVYVNTSTFVFAVYMALRGYPEILLISYLSICLHEGAHALTACCLGHRPTEIEITPLGAMMRLSSDSARIWKKALILLSGPVLTALLCIAAARFASMEYAAIPFWKKVFLCNCTVLLLNLMPCYPLDGGGLLSLLLSCVLPRSTVSSFMRLIGKAIGTVLILFSVYLVCTDGGFNLSLVFAGCLLIYAAHTATTTETLRMLRQYLDRRTALEQRGVMRCKDFVALAESQVLQVMRMLPAGCWSRFFILESGTMRSIGTMTEDEVVACAMSNPATTCAEVLRRKKSMNNR